MNNLKAVAGVLTVLLLLGVSVGSYFILEKWFFDFTSKENFIYDSESSSSILEIVKIRDGILYFNNFQNDLGIIDIKIGNKSCNIKKSFTIGYQNISLEECYSLSDGDVGEISIFTSNDIVEKAMYLEPSFITYSYNWNSTEWSVCTAICDGGIQNRTVWCERNDGLIVQDVLCSQTKLNVSQECNTNSCCYSGFGCAECPFGSATYWGTTAGGGSCSYLWRDSCYFSDGVTLTSDWCFQGYSGYCVDGTYSRAWTFCES